MEFGLLLLYYGEPLYKYGKFSTLLQLTQTHTRSGLLLVLHPASWTVVDNGPSARAC
jgi:hypothetical protein